jgi:hypothetical protein
MSHKTFTSLSASGVPMESLDSHASKSPYDFSADSGEADIRTDAGMIDVVGPPDPLDRDEPSSLEIEVDVPSGSISMFAGVVGGYFSVVNEVMGGARVRGEALVQALGFCQTLCNG